MIKLITMLKNNIDKVFIVQFILNTLSIFYVILSNKTNFLFIVMFTISLLIEIAGILYLVFLAVKTGIYINITNQTTNNKSFFLDSAKIEDDK
ncbi:hypothetical protein [Clostridium sp. BNL1100]|uniref:hypothetical protein n=1 Tax=Clostridium sp. BNL1100 TaxID=755731 RepID=UPI00024A7A8E|nr:hypothetical protein [Clostridium sp. BNL1100]AEY66598.1 hypothetical protein Clo1100_2427 [Clostridium sp. BNL1100]